MKSKYYAICKSEFPFLTIFQSCVTFESLHIQPHFTI